MVRIRLVKAKKIKEADTNKPETPRARRERVFGQAWTELDRLAKGIYETEELQKEFDVMIDELLAEKTKKKSKPNCVSSNPYHLPAEMGDKSGEFTSKDKAGSWSLKFATKGKDCKGKKSGFARVANGKELFQRDCGRANKEGTKKHAQKCSKKAKNEQVKDFTNCKVKDLDKSYKVDKKTGKKTVQIDQGLDCDYQQIKVDPKLRARLMKLANLQKKFAKAEKVSIAKPMFDRFFQWLDQQ